MAHNPAPGRLRAALTVVGACALAVPVPVAAHADPATAEIHDKIDQNAEDLTRVVQQYEHVHATLTRAKATADTITEKLVPLVPVDTAVRFGAGPGRVFRGFPDEFPSATIRNKAIGTLANAWEELDAEKRRLEGLITEHNRQEAELSERKSAIEARNLQLVAQRDTTRAAQAATSPGNSVPGRFIPPVNASAAEIAIAFAHAQLGKPYVFGAAGPHSYDCSGLVMAAWAAADVQVGGHQTHAQYAATARVDRSQLQPGDLVFFYGREHVGLYIGNNQVIHAPTSGDVVKIASLNYLGGYAGAGRPH